MSITKKIFHLILAQGINAIVNFLFFPYLARSLSYDDYATYGQTLVVIGLFTNIFGLGLYQIIHLYLSKKQVNQNQVISSNIFAALSLGIAGSFVVFLFSETLGELFRNPSLSSTLKIYLFAIPFITINNILSSVLIFRNKVKKNAAILIIINLFKVSLVLIAVQVFSSLDLAIFSILSSVIIHAVVLFFMVRFDFFRSINLKLSMNQVKLGIPLGLTGLFGSIILYMDSLMVSFFKGTEQYAIYKAGAFEVPFVSIIYASIAMVILPELNKLIQSTSNKEFVAFKKRAIMNSIYIVYPILIFLLFFSGDFIQVYLGDKFKDSAIIFAVFNLTLLVRVNDYSDILIAKGKTKFILYAYILSLIINFLLNIVLINYFGIVGAAIATVASIFSLALIQLLFTSKLCNVKLGAFFEFPKLFKLLAVFCAVVGAIKLLSLMIDDVIIKFVFAAILFFILSVIIMRSGLFLSKDLLDKILKN